MKSIIIFFQTVAAAILAPAIKSVVLAITNIERLREPITTDKQGNLLSKPLTHVLSVKGDAKVLELLGLEKGRIFVPESTLMNFMDKQGLIHEDELKAYLSKGSVNLTIEYQETVKGQKYKQGEIEWTAGEKANDQYPEGHIYRRINKRILGFTAAGEKEYSGNTLAAITQAKVNRYTAGMKQSSAPVAKAEVKPEGDGNEKDANDMEP